MPPSLPAFTEPPAIIEQVKELPWQSGNTQQPKTYTVKENDNLTKISEAHSVPLTRLWAANEQLTDPNLITPGMVLKIPHTTDVLQDRPMPSTISTSAGDSSPRPQPSTGVSSYSGNTYFAGQCVWYVKNQLPWVQNGWGNASQWKYTSGHTVSSVPAVGTVAWTKAYGHVSIVISVGDGTVTVREMNYQGPYIVSTRTAPTSEFEYIYP